MPQQQGEYEKFLEEERRRKSLEDEFGAFVQEQERKRGARKADILDDLLDEFVASQQKSQPQPQPQPSPPAYLPPSQRQEFNYRRPLDLDTALNQASQRRIKAEGALQEKSRSIKLRPDWRTAPRPIEEPFAGGQVQGPPVFKPKGQPGAMPKVGSLKPQDFNAADIERRIVETVADPSNASRFTADEWAAMEATVRNVAEREAQERQQGRLREIEDQRQLDKANAPSYPVQLVNRFMRGATGTVTSAVRGASLLHPAMEADLRAKGVLQTPQQYEDTMRTLAPVDPTDESLLSKGAEALGSAVPFAAASYLGAGAGAPAWLTSAALGAASNAGQVYDEAIAAGENEEGAKRAAIVGALIGLTEGVGVGRMGGKVSMLGSARRAGAYGLIKEVGKEFAKEFGEEGLQEFTQQILNNVNAKIVSGYDPKRALSEGVAESFLLGGFGGGALGGISGVAMAGRTARSKRYAQALEAKPMEAPTSRRVEAVSPPAPMIPPATPKQTEVIKIPSGPPAVDSGTAAPRPATQEMPAIQGPARPTERILPRVTSPDAETSDLPAQTGTGLANLGGAARTMAENYRQAVHDSVARKGTLPGAERGSLLDQVFEAAAARGYPRNADTLDKALQLAGQGARAAQQQFDQVFLPAAPPAASALARAARPGAEEMTPGFRDESRRRALAMTGLSPDAIEAEMAKLPQLGQPTAAMAAPQPATKTAPDEPRSQGTILGSGLGSLQPMLENMKLPSRAEISETAGSVQTAAQLGNPRFVIRNVLQHIVYGKQERAATRLAATLDWAYSKTTGKPRQIAAPRGSDLQSYARNWSKAVQAYKAGRPLPGNPNADYITADANKLGRAVGKVMAWINAIPDAANWQTRFEGSLQSIVAASKKSKAPLDVDAAIDQAWMEANHAALRDKNFASMGMMKIKEGFNWLSKPIFGTDKFGAGDFILKYAQTPGALLKRGLERSPLGLFQVAKEAATPGQFRRRNTLLALSRVAEGAATGVGLGAALAAGGLLTGPEEESRTGKDQEREEGVRGYSLNASALLRFLTGESTEMREGDTLYGIDWLQPWAMNLSAGAAIYNLYKQGKLGPTTEAAGATGEAIYNSLAKTLDIMGDQSVLKNLSRYASRVQGETEGDKWLNALKAVGLDVPSSFVPSLARQARQVVDPFERDTRAEQPGGVGGFVSEATNRALAQLPGASQAFPTRPRPKPVAREADRLREAGFEIALGMPKRRLFEPTSALREREQQFAVEFSDAARRLIEHPLYNEYVDEVKAAAINNLAKYLRERTTKELRDRTLEQIISAAAKGVARRKQEEP